MAELTLEKLGSEKKRREIPKLPPGERVKNFDEVEIGFSTEDAMAEAMRCLTCEIGICVGCKICAENCPNAVITIITKYNEKLQRYVFDYNIDISRCLFCGICEEVCPTGCLTMSKEYELATYDKKDMICSMERLDEHKLPKGKE